MGKVVSLDTAGNETTSDGFTRALSHHVKTSGIIVSGQLAVSENDTPDNQVKVAVGSCFIGQEVYTADQYRFYFGFADAEELVTITANSSGNPRVDAVVAYIDTTAAGADDNDGALLFDAVAGTPAASPTAPTDADIQTSLGSGVRWLRLANVDVANGFSTITDSDIANQDTLCTFNPIVADSVMVSGTNGIVIMNAETDGGDFNIYTNASGDLAFYGSGGNALNLRLLDGTLKVDTIAESTTGAGITFSDVVHLPNNPVAKVRRTTTQTISNNSFTLVQWDAEEQDALGMHDNSTNNTRITVPTGGDGVYLAIANIGWTANATGQRAVRFYVSGTGYPVLMANTVNFTYSVTSFTDVFVLSAGDYVEVAVYQNSGGDLTLRGGVLAATQYNSSFSLIKIA